MFFNTHAYIASKIYKSNNNLILIGSILPDIALTGIIPWEDGLHSKSTIKKFRKFIEVNNPELIKLCDGIATHLIVDDYSHNKYRGDAGYAFQNNREISNLAKKYYGIDNLFALKITHNFIESGVEILLLKENSNVQIQMKSAIENVNVNLISNVLATFFKIDQSKFKKALSVYFKLINKYNLKEFDKWILFWDDLEKIMLLDKIDKSKKRKLLKMSVKLIDKSYKDFLEYTVITGQKEIQKLI